MTELTDIVTHTRASGATYVDSNGVLQTAGVNVPRVGHHVWNGSAWVNEGVLHESEARTNVFSYNKFDDAALQSTSQTLGASVQIGGSGSGVTTEVVAVGLEGGIPYFDWDVSGTNTGGSTLFIRIRDTASIAAVDGDTYTVSANLKLVSGSVTENNSLQFYCHFRDAGDALIAAPAFALGASLTSQWQRFHASLTGTGASISKIVEKGIFLRVSAGGSVNFRVRIGGMQVEKAPTPSSYIPTSGSTVTRAADVMTIPSANLPWPAPEVIGPELVTNGTFDTDTTGWSNGSSAGGSIAWNAAGYLDLVNTSGNARARQDGIGLTTGKVYLVSVTNIGGATANVTYQENASPFGTVVLGDVPAGQTKTFPFVAQFATHRLLVANFNIGTTVSLDNISVREINPLAVSIQMDGRVTYADEGIYSTVVGVRWYADFQNRIVSFDLSTNGTETGRVFFLQENADVYDFVGGPAPGSYSPGVLVPFNIASRHGSTFINGAVDGTALTANTTPVALPDLSATDLQLGFDYMGTIKTLRIWADDIGDAGIAGASA